MIQTTGLKEDPRRKFKQLSIDELLQVEDKDLQKYLVMTHMADSHRTIFRNVNNDEKIAFYEIERIVKFGNTGSVYCTNKLIYWIIYDKKTKKLRMKAPKDPKSSFVRSFLEQYFSSTTLLTQMFYSFTATLCKRIITGKINSIEDVLKYHRSYTIRNKNISLDSIYDAFVTGKWYLLNVVEDPENIDWYGDIKLDSRISEYKIFKFKAHDISEAANGRFLRWIDEQSRKLDSLPGYGDAETGVISSFESNGSGADGTF